MGLMKKLIVGLVALVAVLVGSAVALGVVAIFVVDPGDYRNEIARELESATGRKVSFGGPLQFSMSLHPALVVNEATFANADWGSRKDMATVRRLAFEVALIPLLNGVLHVRSVSIEGADVLLETSKDGIGNWTLGEGGGGSAAGSTGGIRVDSVEIVDSTFTYLDGANGRERVFTVSRGTMQADAADAPMTIDIAMSFKEGAGSVSGTVDSLASLLAGSETHVDLAVSAPNVDLKAKGTLGALSGSVPFDLVASLDIASLGLFESLGITDLPMDGALAFSGHLTGVPDKLKIEDLRLALAGTNLSGTLGADISGETPSFTGDLAADAIDLAKWTGDDGSGSSGDRLFPEDPLPVAWMQAADADLRLKVASLSAAGFVFEDVTATVTLAHGKLTVEPFSLGVENSTVDGVFSLDGAASPPALALKLSSKGFDMGALLKQSGVTEALTGAADIDVDVSGAGASTAAVMAALDGKASLVMIDGHVDEAGLDLFLGGARAIIGGLFEKDSGSAKLSCLAAAWDVKDGLADQTVLLIDTQYSTLTGKGAIDLGKETVDETLTPNAKGVSLSLAVPVRIHGRLVDPTVTPDEGALAVKVGSLIGSVFFPPAALIGLGDLGIGAGHPCVAANAPGSESSGGISTGAAVDGAGKVIDDAAGAVGSAIEDVGKGLGNLFGD